MNLKVSSVALRNNSTDSDIKPYLVPKYPIQYLVTVVDSEKSLL